MTEEGQEKALYTKVLPGECRENAPEMSADELLAQKSPKGEVTLARVPVTCILGDKTSLVSHSFYKDNLINNNNNNNNTEDL